MLSHRNLHWASGRFREAFGTTADDEVLSYLPLCHVAERLSTYQRDRHGYVVNFGEGGESFPQDLREVQPTFFLGVPRVWEKMLASVEIRMADASRLKRATYRYAMRTGKQLAPKRMAGRLGRVDRLRAGIGERARPALAARQARPVAHADRGVRRRADRAAGARVVLGARHPRPRGLRADGEHRHLHVHAGRRRPHRHGRPPLPGVELKIADDGEILTRSPAIFLGYFHNEEATAEAVDADGWLHTGDVGEIDDDGYLTITDRKKDIIITAGGKNISPSEIENKLKVSPYVREAIVVGDRRKYLVALIGVELDTVGDWAARKGLAFTTYGDLARKREVRELIGEWVEQSTPSSPRSRPSSGSR